MNLSVKLVFFFSSRRRHTRFDCDWSSDVCSSDLFVRTETLQHIALFDKCKNFTRAREVQAAGLYPYFKPISRSEDRSEEHTSELQSQSNLVCRLLLEKKKQVHTRGYHDHCPRVHV